MDPKLCSECPCVCQEKRSVVEYHAANETKVYLKLIPIDDVYAKGVDGWPE